MVFSHLPYDEVRRLSGVSRGLNGVSEYVLEGRPNDPKWKIESLMNRQLAQPESDGVWIQIFLQLSAVELHSAYTESLYRTIEVARLPSTPSAYEIDDSPSPSIPLSSLPESPLLNSIYQNHRNELLADWRFLSLPSLSEGHQQELFPFLRLIQTGETDSLIVLWIGLLGRLLDEDSLEPFASMVPVATRKSFEELAGILGNSPDITSVAKDAIQTLIYITVCTLAAAGEDGILAEFLHSLAGGSDEALLILQVGVVALLEFGLYRSEYGLIEVLRSRMSAEALLNTSTCLAQYNLTIALRGLGFQEPEPVDRTGVPFDIVCSLTLYNPWMLLILPKPDGPPTLALRVHVSEVEERIGETATPLRFMEESELPEIARL
ncbi:hypothetical protein H4R33_006065 [Dimargaris cristalligena]|uniref:Uncharacterized protein n=1 Tax=Dimargaris cristalligena TaxID=215637 RepID=A0A4Q0A276_9FUNG|nr:hypothetical protein H4R33_006065 [Dimargaris cristalligena]RKP40205.1 hypothetical protein BJ085DRAFT_37591 [Dimargaris cristalligena]|eukprot:RKP40205.1 hypothetical protein BJ085DRAFT_37591 [Dimargaris cristalligena]